MKKVLFLDTNVFEHFPPVDQIDWPTVADCNQATLAVPQITIRELNRHKDSSPRGKLRRRAASALAQLTKWARQPQPVHLRGGVDLIFINREPILDFAAHGLSGEIPDDYLVATAIQFTVEAGEPIGRVFVTTADLGLELKIRGYQAIGPCPMPEGLRLPDEPDSDERQISALQRELDELKAQYPRVTMALQKRSTNLDLDLAPIEWVEGIASREELESDLARQRAEHPYLCPSPACPPGYRFLSADMNTLQSYNDELNIYFELHGRWLRASAQCDAWQRRTRTLGLVLRNDGGAIAENVEVTINFPGGIVIVPESDYRTLPEPPLPPEIEKGNGRWKVQKRRIKVVDYPGNTEQGVEIQKISTRDSGCVVTLTVSTIRHTSHKSIPLHVHFLDRESVHPFQIEYDIWVSNYPKRTGGKLTIETRMKANGGN